MSEVDTGVRCPVCEKANIVAVVESVPTASIMEIPIGPGSANYYRTRVTCFHCGECQVTFHHPPGKPDSELDILRQIKSEESEADIQEMSEAIRKAAGL